MSPYDVRIREYYACAIIRCRLNVTNSVLRALQCCCFFFSFVMFSAECSTQQKKTAESRRAIVATSTVLHSRWPSLHNLPINRHSQNAISSAFETQNTNTTIPIVWMSSRVCYCSLAIAISYHCISHILYIRSIILKAFWHDQCAGHVRNLWLPVGMSNTI